MNWISEEIMARKLGRHCWRGRSDLRAVPSFEMEDGAKMSVQASEYHYCEPRENNPTGGWYSFEVWGCKGLTCEELYSLSETPLDEPSGWVRFEVLDKIVKAHGGLKRNYREMNENGED